MTDDNDSLIRGVSVVEEVEVPPDALHVDGENPNEQSDETFGLLVDSIRDGAWLGGPIIVNRGALPGYDGDGDGLICDGEHRWRAAQEAGQDTVPVKFCEFRHDAVRRYYRLHLNKVSGEHDPESDAYEYDRLLRSGHKSDVFDLVNASDENLEELLDELDTGADLSEYPHPVEDTNEPFEAECSPGDYIALGNHRLLCADSTVSANVSAALSDTPADAVFTDPPFNISGSTTGLGDDVTDHALIAPFFNSMAATLAENTRLAGHVYICCDWRTYPLVWDTVGSEMAPKNLIVWDKGDPGIGANYQNQHEFLIFLHNYSQDQTARGEIERPDIQTTTGSNVWSIAREQDKDLGDDLRDHFAKKPTELPTRAIENSTQYGKTVLDPFGGTGTTLIAAEQTGRKCVMLEADPSYCDSIIRRWEQTTGETAKRLDTPESYVTHDPDDMETVGEAKRQREASVNAGD